MKTFSCFYQILYCFISIFSFLNSCHFNCIQKLNSTVYYSRILVSLLSWIGFYIYFHNFYPILVSLDSINTVHYLRCHFVSHSCLCFCLYFIQINFLIFYHFNSVAYLFNLYCCFGL